MFGDAFQRIGAIFLKEFVQMRRDRVTFATMITMPIIQLTLFGFAINTDPKHLPTAVHVEEQTPIIRTILTGLETSEYFDLTMHLDDPRDSQHLLARGEVLFVISFPAGFTERLIRGERPQILIEADASDPVAAGNALGNVSMIIDRALKHDLKGPLASLAPAPSPVEMIVHRRYNPEGITQYNIVPGLLGVILTMTLIMFTGMAMTREAERGNLENLLAMPAKPIEVMIGKITPFIFVGAIQTTIILSAAKFVFGVPFAGPIALLLLGVFIFMLANLALGFTFSAIAKSQIEAMQLTFFFFLPSMLLSGFMFPFRGMPEWAQGLGEILPLTHFLRVVRGVMLKSATFADMGYDLFAMTAFAAFAVVIAMVRYRTTLD